MFFYFMGENIDKKFKIKLLEHPWKPVLVLTTVSRQFK